MSNMEGEMNLSPAHRASFAQHVMNALSDAQGKRSYKGPDLVHLGMHETLAGMIIEGCQKDKILESLQIDESTYWKIKPFLLSREVRLDGDGPSIVLQVVGQRGANGGLKAEVVTQLANDAENFEAATEKVDESIKAADIDSNKAEEKERELENSFYPLVKLWAISQDYDPLDIANSRARKKWQNPDLISIIPVHRDTQNALHYEVVSFEVKLRVEPVAVWQALNYLTFSDEAYVAFCRSEDEIKGSDVFDLAVKHGIGVLALTDERRFKEIQSPRKNYPDWNDSERALNEFSKIDQIEVIIRNARFKHMRKLRASYDAFVEAAIP